jgi:hypothetical protein
MTAADEIHALAPRRTPALSHALDPALLTLRRVRH